MPAPLELLAEVTDANGTKYRWGPNEGPQDRLLGVNFSTKIGEGFSSLSGSLPRRIDLDYPDLNLVDTITIYGADGSVAWEGRVSALPRELGDTHSIGVTGTGHMAHAKDQPFSRVYVDRDLGAWGPMSLGRKAMALASNVQPVDPVQSVDPTNNQAGVTTAYEGPWASPYKKVSEAWYDAGAGNAIGSIFFAWKRSGPGIALPDANWSWRVVSSSDDLGTALESGGNLSAAGPGSGTRTPTNRYRYAYVVLDQYGATPAGTAGARYGIDWYSLAVYGDHGLPLYTGEPGQPDGVIASDVIKDIAAGWCPKFDTSGVQDTTYVIQHLAWRDLIDPYDAFLEVNKYHLWNLAVWEDRGSGPRLTFEPYDLTDYDWEIRTDEQGTTFSPQGPGIDDLANGMYVVYNDALTGKKTRLSPADFPDQLQDFGVGNVWGSHGIKRWPKIELSSPSIQAQALELGRAALADRNTPKTPGTITVRGYIRDRQGNEQPVWKVRAGDTIAVTNFPNDTPRLIVETSYDDANKAISLSIDRPFALLDAYLDRQAMALQARGLG